MHFGTKVKAVKAEIEFYKHQLKDYNSLKTWMIDQFKSRDAAIATLTSRVQVAEQKMRA